MKKRIAAWTMMVLLLVSLLSVAGCAATGGKAAAEARKGVVRVVALRPDGYYATGSAFGVGKVGEQTDMFITNHHVIYDTYQLEDGSIAELPAVTIWILRTSNAWNDVTGLDTTQCIPCEIVYAEEDGYPDMAIIKASEPVPGRVALPLLGDEDSLEAGDNVYALGYPGSSDFTEQGIYGEKWVAGVEDVTITSGVVSRFTTSTTFGNTRLIQHDAQINHGNSGGPLLNENGVVVGINTYGFGEDISSGDGRSFASIRIDHMIDVLDDLEIYYETDSASFPTLYVLIGAALVIVLVVVVVLIARKPKAAQTSVVTTPGPVSISPTAPADAPVVAGDNGPRIQCLAGAFAGQRFSIDGSVRMGRDPSRNDLVFPTDTQGISGVHCVVFVENGAIWLKDLGSTYGTFVRGGQRLAASEPIQVQIGEKFWLGSEREVFVIAPKGGI